MIEIPFLLTEAVFTAVWLLLRLAVWVKNRQIDWKREAVLLLMYINLAVMIRFTFFPMALLNGKVQPLLFDPETMLPFRLNLVPFVHLLDYDSRRDLLLNVLGNFCMFIPSGIVLPVVYKKLNGFWKVVGAGALISLGFELLQLPFSERASDVDDLLLNIAGVIVGYAIYSLVKRPAKSICA